MFSSTRDLLKELSSGTNFSTLDSLRSSRVRDLDREHWREVQELLAQLPATQSFISYCQNSGELLVGDSSCEEAASKAEVRNELVEALIPWRKGPFSVQGTTIDTEWRSELKWARLRNALGALEGRRILDVGCGNGYYMFRALLEGCESALGLDPSELFYLQFRFLQSYIQESAIQLELLGLEHCTFFDPVVDIVLCMGVLYHQRSPLDALRTLAHPLKKHGRLVIETQVIPGTGFNVFSPPGRYAKARNVYFLPTTDCLVAWIERSGYRDVEVHSVVEITTDEQRSTELAPYESLSDFLDPLDRTLTVEGHPASLRAVVSARKK